MQTQDRAVMGRYHSRLCSSLRMVGAAACLWPALAAAQTWNPTGSDDHNNTAAGGDALDVVTGYENTAIGKSALKNTTDGNYNTGLGSFALFHNTTGGYNTASGHIALYNNTTGVNNTASGYAALGNNRTGNWNTADGYRALGG